MGGRSRGESICIFACGKNYCFARSSPRKQQSTGLLHLILQIPPSEYHAKEKRPPVRWSFFFGGEGGI